MDDERRPRIRPIAAYIRLIQKIAVAAAWRHDFGDAALLQAFQNRCAEHAA
jgi:hypothetical protein